MFRLFKKKPKRDKLLDLYNKKIKKAYKLSTVNRSKSDRLKKEASDILEKIEMIGRIKNS